MSKFNISPNCVRLREPDISLHLGRNVAFFKNDVTPCVDAGNVANAQTSVIFAPPCRPHPTVQQTGI